MRLSVLTRANLQLVVVLLLAIQPSSWGQDSSWWGPTVKVLAETEGHVFDWSPDGQRLAYADDQGIVLLEAPDFREARRLDLPGWEGVTPISDLRWSPSGRRIAFVSPWKHDDWATIWLIESKPTEVRDLLPPAVSDRFTSTGVRALTIGPWLSEHEIVFGRHCGPECSDIYKVDVETTSYGGLCVAGVDGGLHWAESKDRAIISGHNGAVGLALSKNFRALSSSPAEAGCPDLLPGCAGGSKGPWFGFEDWSPDGNYVLLTRHACQNGSADVVPGRGELVLWTVNHGSPQMLLANATNATWSPNGAHIAFILLGKPVDGPTGSVGSGSTAGQPFEAHLATMEVATRSVSVLASLGIFDPEEVCVAVARGEWRLVRPVWSPDSHRLAFRDSKHNLHIIWRDGTDQRLVVRAKRSVASWSPDARRLAIRVGKRSHFWVGAEPPYLVEIQ